MRTGELFHQDLQAVAKRHFPGLRVMAAERLTGGVSASVYRLDLEAPDGARSRVVLRAHGPTHGGHDAQLEYDLLRAVARLGLPVPEALAADASVGIWHTPM